MPQVTCIQEIFSKLFFTKISLTIVQNFSRQTVIGELYTLPQEIRDVSLFKNFTKIIFHVNEMKSNHSPEYFSYGDRT